MFTFWAHLDKKVLLWMFSLWFSSLAVAVGLGVPTVFLLERYSRQFTLENPGWLNLLGDLSRVMSNNWLLVVPVLVIGWGLVSFVISVFIASQNSRISKWSLILFSLLYSVTVWVGWWYGLVYLPFMALLP